METKWGIHFFGLLSLCPYCLWSYIQIWQHPCFHLKLSISPVFSLWFCKNILYQLFYLKCVPLYVLSSLICLLKKLTWNVCSCSHQNMLIFMHDQKMCEQDGGFREDRSISDVLSGENWPQGGSSSTYRTKQGQLSSELSTLNWYFRHFDNKGNCRIDWTPPLTVPR